MAEYDGIYIDENSFTEQMAYIAERTATVEEANIQQVFANHIQTIKTLNSKYEQLQTYSSSIATVFQNRYRYSNLKKSIRDEGFVPQEALELVYKDAQTENREYVLLTQFLDAVRKWSVDSYKEIISFRQLVTNGQQIVYDVQEGAQTSYRLTEDQYLDLISSNLKTRNRDKSWESVNGDNFIDMLKLSIDKPSSADYQEKAIIGRTHDALYKYIYENYSKEVDKSKGLAPSRMYEIYTQARYSFFKSGDYTSSVSQAEFDAHKTKVRNFVNNYITSNLHKDSDKFYQMGDSIENNMTLIENKYGTKAAISIRTIKNAIQELNDIISVPSSQAELTKKFQNFYVQQGDSALARSIQRGAAAAAKRGIKEYFSNFSNEDIQIILSS